MSTDDTMRRIEEALDAYETAARTYRDDAEYKQSVRMRADFLATIRAALQPDAGGWGEDDDRHRANEEAELLKPHEFTGRHRSYQELLDAEHERAVEAWLDRVHYVNGNYLVFGADIDEALRLMRRQPKETTDGK